MVLPQIKILVCGSRGYKDYAQLCEILDNISQDYLVTLVSGGAHGADGMAEQWADDRKHKKIIHLPDWDKNGKSAGYIRNKQMIDEDPEYVIAFWDGVSKGTKNTLDLARTKKIITTIYYF